MSKLRQLIRLYSQGESKLNISQLTGIARNTVKKYIRLFDEKRLSIEEVEALNDEQLEMLMGLESSIPEPQRYHQLITLLPEYTKRLKKRNVSRESLWKEYITQYPQGYKIAQFKRHLRKWLKYTNPVMHIEHKAGDKMYIDFTGEKLHIVDRETGEIQPKEVFLSVLGASQYTYLEAVESQKKEDLILVNENTLWFYGGVPRAIVPDNLKSAVKKTDRYEPTLNEAFEDFASHYSTAILPARVYKPKDKALVEGAVKIIYRRIFDKVNEKIYYSLEELNQALWKELTVYNDTPFTNRPYSRSQLFEEIEKPELQPLPARRYEIRRKQSATVSSNGHVCLREDKNYYSVPYKYIGSQIRILYSNSQVDIYHRYVLIATHSRNRKPYAYITDPAHLASTHRFIGEWNPERFIRWAQQIDEIVGQYILGVMDSKPHPEQAYKSCQGILLFERKVGRERLVNACKRANDFGIYNYGVIKTILENGYDSLQEADLFGQIPDHDNIRGEDYYQ